MKSCATLPPMPKRMTAIIARRDFRLMIGKRPRSLTLEIGKPKHDVVCKFGMAWRCPIRITFKNKKLTRSACGEDAIQALLHGISLAKIELRSITASNKATLKWLGGLDLSLDLLPVQKNSRENR